MRSTLLTTDQSFIQHSCALGGPWVEEKAFRSTSALSLQRCVPLPGYNHPGSQAALASSSLLMLLETGAALNRMQKPSQAIHETCGETAVRETAQAAFQECWECKYGLYSKNTDFNYKLSQLIPCAVLFYHSLSHTCPALGMNRDFQLVKTESRDINHSSTESSAWKRPLRS